MVVQYLFLHILEERCISSDWRNLSPPGWLPSSPHDMETVGIGSCCISRCLPLHHIQSQITCPRACGSRSRETESWGRPFTWNSSITSSEGWACSSFSIWSSGRHSRSSPPLSSGRSSHFYKCCICDPQSRVWSWGRWMAGSNVCWSARRTSGSWRVWGPP